MSKILSLQKHLEKVVRQVDTAQHQELKKFLQREVVRTKKRIEDLILAGPVKGKQYDVNSYVTRKLKYKHVDQNSRPTI